MASQDAAPVDVATTLPPAIPAEPPALPPSNEEQGEPKYGGYTRFEIELEFVQALGNPHYLNHLAAQKYLSQPAFVAYLDYLQYWTRPPYLKYLTYPGPALKHLQLLQQERFREEIVRPDVVQRLVDEGMHSAVEWHQQS